MKKLLLFLLLVPLVSHGRDIAYDYDESGNRVSRGLVVTEMSVGRGADKSKRAVSDIFDRVSVRVYPNPTDGQLCVEVPVNGDGQVSLKLYSASGSLIYSSQGESRSVIDLGDFPSGSYILSVAIGDDVKTWNVIKR